MGENTLRERRLVTVVFSFFKEKRTPETTQTWVISAIASSELQSSQ